jgi:hypothetical protein
LVKSGQHLTYIAASDIAFFRSSDGLTQAHLFSGKKYFVDHTLDELEGLLDPANDSSGPGGPWRSACPRHPQDSPAPERTAEGRNRAAGAGGGVREPRPGGSVQDVAGGLGVSELRF